MNSLINSTDKIEVGEYAGETLYSCLVKYGRKSLLKLLKYYEVNEAVLRANHYHRVPNEESVIGHEYYEVEDWMTTMTIPVNTPTYNIDDKNCRVSDEDALNSPGLVELDDDSRSSSWCDYEDDGLYDPEDELIDSNNYSLVKGGWMNPRSYSKMCVERNEKN